LHADIGEWMAAATLAVLDGAGVHPEDVAAVGSHGQTIWHIPPEDGRRGATLQLGDPSIIAERTGIDVVSDFRSRDVAAGGHGAPLVPFADRILFSLSGRSRVLQNLGGIANVTWLPPRGSASELLAFDTGPGNALIDLAAERATGGRLLCDLGGAMAARGDVIEPLLARLLADPFFGESPPRSTGRERFGDPLLDTVLGEHPCSTQQQWDDLLATLTELTARSIGDAYRRWVLPLGVDDVVLTGGGARNAELVRRIEAALDPVPLADSASLGLDPAAREAAAFAVLAWAHLLGTPANVPSATGALGGRVLGSFTPGGRGSASG